MTSTQLPPDLLYSIADKLATDRQTLSTLLLVSKAFHRAARVFVFRDISVTFNAYWAESERVQRLLNLLQEQDTSFPNSSTAGKEILMILQNLTIIFNNTPVLERNEDDNWTFVQIVRPAQTSQLRTLFLLLSTAPNLQSLTLVGSFNLQHLGIPTLRALVNLRCQAGTHRPSLKNLRLAGLSYIPPLLVTGVPGVDILVTLETGGCEGHGHLSPTFPFSEPSSTPSEDHTDPDPDTDALFSLIQSPGALQAPPLQRLEVFETSDIWGLSWILGSHQGPTHSTAQRPRFELASLKTLTRRGPLASEGYAGLQATLDHAPALEKVVIAASTYYPNRSNPAAGGSLSSPSVTDFTFFASTTGMDSSSHPGVSLNFSLERAYAVLFGQGPMGFPKLQTLTIVVHLNRYRPGPLPRIPLKCHHRTPLNSEGASGTSPNPTGRPSTSSPSSQDSLGGHHGAGSIAMIRPKLFDQIVDSFIEYWPNFERQLRQQVFRKLSVVFRISPSDSKSSVSLMIDVPYETWVRHTCDAEECRQVVQAVKRLAGTLGRTQSQNGCPEVDLVVSTYLYDGIP